MKRRLVLLSVFTASCLLAPRMGAGAPKTGGGPGGILKADGTSALALWLKPETLSHVDGAAVWTWPDSSGRANDAYVRHARNTPPTYRLNMYNGFPALDFDGRSNMLSTTSIIAVPAADSIFLVHESDDLVKGQCLVGEDGNAGYVLGPNGSAYRWFAMGNKWTEGIDGINGPGGWNTTNLAILAGVRSTNANFITLYREGVQMDTATHSNSLTSMRYAVGARRPSAPVGDEYDGTVAEVIVIVTNINTAERILVDNYLASKFFTTALPVHDYYDGDTPAKGDYDHDVFGVGRADASNVAPNGGLGGFGIEAVSGLDNGEWVLAGHKQTGGNSRTRADVPAGLTYRWQRVWCVKKTGNMDATLAFDHSDASLTAPAGGTDFALLYSAGRDPYSFTALPIAETVNGDTVSFTVPDADLQDGYYTLASDESVPSIATITSGTGPGGVGRTDGTTRLILWLKPESLDYANGASVTNWPDASGIGNHGKAANATNQYPVYRASAHNGLGAVYFFTNDEIRASQIVTLAGAQSFFIVHKSDRNFSGMGNMCLRGTRNYQDIIVEIGLNSYRWVAGGSWSEGVSSCSVAGHTTNLTIVSGVRSTNLNFQTVYVNGQSKGSLTHSREIHTFEYGLGQRRTEWDVLNGYDGEISEIIEIATNVNAAERMVIDNYLNAKYFDAALAANDRYAGDETAKGDYDLDVFGVGRVSGSDEVAYSGCRGLGLAPLWGLVNGDWVLAGHKVPNNSYVPYEDEAGGAFRWARVWYIDVTGYVDMRLSFDFSDAGLAVEGKNYRLLYSPGPTFSWTELGGPVAVEGDRLHFDVPAAAMVDGYYTIASVPAGTVIMVR